MSRNPLHQRLITIIEPVLQSAGFELVDVRFVLEQGGWVLRVQVDLPLAQVTDIAQVPSERVSLADCENISRELSAVLDVEDPIPQAYHLEISSPGIDRPLRTLEAVGRFIGTKVSLTTHELHEGRRKHEGELLAPEGERVGIVMDGSELWFDWPEIKDMRLVVDPWARVRRGEKGTR